MTDLVVTGPPILDLRWDQRSARRDDGRVERAFFPKTEHQEADGYLHPGVVASAAIAAAGTTVGVPDPLRSVSVAFDAPLPLGMDIDAVVAAPTEGAVAVEFELRERPDREDEPVWTLARCSVSSADELPTPDEGAFRSAAIGPVPAPVDHELYPRCFVCGQDNTRGLDLRPGWQAPDTVVTGFAPSEAMMEAGEVPPAMVVALLSCPTLWACREQLQEMGAAAALLATYDVHLLEPVTGPVQLRTVGIAGTPHDGMLPAVSALMGEDGRMYAAATATWQPVDEVPTRDPGRPDPMRVSSPLKGGRPEERSDPAWGQPLPGRREAPGPRSERPGDRDHRDTIGGPSHREDPSSPRRTLTDEDRGQGS